LHGVPADGVRQGEIRGGRAQREHCGFSSGHAPILRVKSAVDDRRKTADEKM
jgi:hypothetical protein